MQPASAPIRRLTRFEYNNTVRDLMGDTTAPAQVFVAEEEALGFRNNALALGVTPLLAEPYMTAAEGLAERAMKDPARLLTCDRAVLAGTLTGATRTSAEDACARTFIDGFGKRAYRRPLSGDKLQGFVKVFGAGRDRQDFKAGIELFLAAVLQSPHFFYRVEFGTPVAGKPAVARLDS